MSQSSIALGLLKSGSLLLTTGFLWGVFIPHTPYPRIGLSLHINMIQHGLLSLAAGFIMRAPNLVKLSDWQVWMVGLSHFYLWIVNLIMLCNVWWGTNKALTIV